MGVIVHFRARDGDPWASHACANAEEAEAGILRLPDRYRVVYDGPSDVPLPFVVDTRDPSFKVGSCPARCGRTIRIGRAVGVTWCDCGAPINHITRKVAHEAMQDLLALMGHSPQENA